jgi:hypothetical protein
VKSGSSFVSESRKSETDSCSWSSGGGEFEWVFGFGDSNWIAGKSLVLSSWVVVVGSRFGFLELLTANRSGVLMRGGLWPEL